MNHFISSPRRITPLETTPVHQKTSIEGYGDVANQVQSKYVCEAFGLHLIQNHTQEC